VKKVFTRRQKRQTGIQYEQWKNISFKISPNLLTEAERVLFVFSLCLYLCVCVSLFVCEHVYFGCCHVQERSWWQAVGVRLGFENAFFLLFKPPCQMQEFTKVTKNRKLNNSSVYVGESKYMAHFQSVPQGIFCENPSGNLKHAEENLSPNFTVSIITSISWCWYRLIQHWKCICLSFIC